MRNIKISVVGCGYWGKNLVRNFAELKVLRSVCDANIKFAEKSSQAHGVPALTFEQVLNSDCDGVVIAAPAAQHFDLTQRALKAGKHVFVEKPLSLRIDEAQKLCDLSVQGNRKLMVGHLLQYHPVMP